MERKVAGNKKALKQLEEIRKQNESLIEKIAQFEARKLIESKEKTKLGDQLDRKIAEVQELQNNSGQQSNIVDTTVNRLSKLKLYYASMSYQDPQRVKEYNHIMQSLHPRKAEHEKKKSLLELDFQDELEAKIEALEQNYNQKMEILEKDFTIRMKEKRKELNKLSLDIESLQNQIKLEKNMNDQNEKQLDINIKQFIDLKEEINKYNENLSNEVKELQKSIARLDRIYQKQRNNQY